MYSLVARKWFRLSLMDQKMYKRQNRPLITSIISLPKITTVGKSSTLGSLMLFYKRTASLKYGGMTTKTGTVKNITVLTSRNSTYL